MAHFVVNAALQLHNLHRNLSIMRTLQVQVYWMLVHPTQKVLSSATLSNKILLFISGPKSCCLCACHKSKMNFIPQPQEQKSCRRQTQYFSALCGCLCTQPICCCPLQHFQMRYFVVHFDQKSCYFCAYHISKSNLILQPHDQKSCRRQTQYQRCIYLMLKLLLYTRLTNTGKIWA